MMIPRLTFQTPLDSMQWKKSMINAGKKHEMGRCWLQLVQVTS